MEKCKTCQQDFEPSKKFKHYCSNKCKFSRPQSEASKQKLREATLSAARAKGIVPREERTFTCQQCKKPYTSKWDSPSKPSRFCSKSCGNTHRFSQEGARERQAHKVGEWIDRHPTLKRKVETVSVKRIPKLPKERKPRVKKNRTCRSCDCSINHLNYAVKYCSECKKFTQYVPMFIKLNVNVNRDLRANAEEAKSKLMEFYHEMKMSMPEIQKLHKVNMNTLHRFSKRMGFKLRSVSESIKLGIAEGKRKLPENGNSAFKQGWHTTWEGKEFYYRSSYEYDVCNELDQKRIPYEMESLCISYYDSQRQQTRTALPDFHLTESNEIWEVKSEYFFNKTNIQDKFLEYRKLGYDCKLILEHKEYSFEEVLVM